MVAANVHPIATGPAAKLVEKHQEPQELTFHAAWFCPFAQRVWIALEEKGVPYRYNEVNPYKKEKHFLEINPRGLVPAVEYHGKALYESLILLEFLDDAYPKVPLLFTNDPLTKGYLRIWIDHISKNIVPAQMRLTMAQEAEKQKAALEELNTALRALGEKVKGPYFLGEKFSVVDAVVGPWIIRDYVIVENRGFTREGVSSEWVAYAKAIDSRPSVKNTLSERVDLDVLYVPYLRDEAQSQTAKAIRAGRAI